MTQNNDLSLKVCNIVQHIQKVLRIQDFDITVKFETEKELYYAVGDSCAGCCQIQPDLKEATILINADDEQNSGDGWYYTLLHELIHVTLEDIETFLENELGEKVSENLNYISCIEKTTNRLAKALARLIPLDSFDGED